MASVLQVLALAWMFIVTFFCSAAALGMAVGGAKDVINPRRRNDEPKVTFVVAVWNEGRRIRKCVNSILAQKYPRKKIKIIVIGGGDEKTLETCRGLSASGKAEFMWEKKRSGKWFALNTALKRVKDDYVAFTDGDCVLEKEWLRKMVARDADVVITDFYSLSEKRMTDKLYAFVLFLGTRFGEAMSAFTSLGEFAGHGMLAKMKVLRKIRFRDSFIEDWRFVSDAKGSGFSVEHSDAKVYEHGPETLNDLRKGQLRLVKGFLSEGRWNIPLAVMAASTLALVSVPVNAYQIINSDGLTVASTAAMAVSAALFMAVSSARYRAHRFILYLPMLVPLALFIGLFSAESLLKITSGRKITWEMYKKKS